MFTDRQPLEFLGHQKVLLMQEAHKRKKQILHGR